MNSYTHDNGAPGGYSLIIARKPPEFARLDYNIKNPDGRIAKTFAIAQLRAYQDWLLSNLLRR